MGYERPTRGGIPEAAGLHAVSSAVLAVTRHLSVHEVLQVIVRAAAQLLDAQYAALGLPDDEGSFAEFVVEGVSDEQRAAIGPMPRQHGMLAVMLREQVPLRLADIRAQPEFEGWPAAHPRLRDFLGVPIRNGEEMLGIIFLANKRRPDGFTEADQELLTLFAAHAAIAISNARLYERNRELTVVAERNRLARELHDAVAQRLFSLRLTAQAAASLADRDPDRTRVELRHIEQMAADALAELRAVISELRPADLDGDGLAASLRKHVQVIDRVYEAKVTLSADPGIALPDDREAVLFRIAQEALYNAVRHSGAKSIEVRLFAEDGAAVLEVHDDGSGFEVANSGRPDPGGAAGRTGYIAADGGLGLASMRERALSVGGRLSIDAAPRAGTVVRMEVPDD